MYKQVSLKIPRKERQRSTFLFWCRYMKEYAEKFYKSKAWKETAKAYTKSVGGLCEMCLAKGIYKPGALVHHKIHITPENISDESITLDWNNLKLVCRECHAREHGKTRRYTIDAQGRATPIF